MRTSFAAGLKPSFFLGAVLALAGCAENAGAPLSFEEFARAQKVAEGDASVDPRCDEDCRVRRIEFRYVVYVGKQIYCYWPEKRAETGLDYDALAKRLEESIETSTSLTEYYRTLRKWAAAFHDGHVNVMPPDGMAGLDVYSTPLRVEIFSPGGARERLFVSDSSIKTTASSGDEITAVNGKSVKEALDEGEAEASGSTKRMRRLVAARRLLDVLGSSAGIQPLNVEFRRRPNGRRTTASLFRKIAVAPLPSRDQPLKPEKIEKTGIENVRASVLPGGIGYLRIDAFSGTRSSDVLDAAMRSLADTKALLIDLRANGGGDLSGDRILGRLAVSEGVRYERSSRLSPYLIASRPSLFEELDALDWSAPYAPWKPLKFEAINDRPYRGKPVIALTSAWCFSACDTFVAALKANGLAKIAGEPTGGGTGTPHVFELPMSGFKFRYSVLRGRTAKGDPIEGAGTIPDVLIEASPSDLGSDRDEQLAQALRLLTGPDGRNAGQASELAESIGKAFGPPVKQNLDVAPTIEENRRLWDLSERAERP